MGFSDRDIECYYAPFDPAFMTDAEPVDEHREETTIIMGDLFAELEKVFSKFDRYDKDIMIDNDSKIIEKVYELMEG